MAKIEIDRNIIKDEVNKMISVFLQEKVKLDKKRHRFLSRCIKAAMDNYNKRCLFGIGRINREKAFKMLVDPDYGFRYRRFHIKMQKYYNKIAPFDDNLNNLKKIYKINEFVTNRCGSDERHSRFIILDYEECLAIEKAEKLCDKIKK